MVVVATYEINHDFIKQEIQKQGLSQNEFCTKCGVSTALGSLWFNNKRTVSEKDFKKMCEVLHLDFQDLRRNAKKTIQDE